MSLTDENEKKEKDIEYYPTPGSIRYITFIQQDGKRKALSYSLLPEIDFDPGNEHNTIIMTFPTCKITLTGYCLEKLCEDLENEKVRSVRVTNERYIGVESGKEKVTTIEIS